MQREQPSTVDTVCTHKMPEPICTPTTSAIPLYISQESFVGILVVCRAKTKQQVPFIRPTVFSAVTSRILSTGSLKLRGKSSL
jgi:hypothetical protein